jgi:acyl-CoA synthetase (AMP-forming)/AMP-acid ligase II
MAFPDYTPTVPAFIRNGAERFGPKTLITLGERRVSYAEANAESADLARGLLAAGIGKGTRVGLLMPNGPDWLLAWLAAARIGALVVPINTFYQSRELGWILRHADVHTLLTVPGFLSHDYLERLETCAPELADAGELPLFAPSLPYLRQVLVWGDSDRKWTRPGGAALAERGATVDDELLRAVEDCVAPSDALVLIYSSGSTADPKGAVHTHGGIIRHSANLNSFRDINENDRVYSPMPFFWVGGFTFALLSAMHAGACLLCEEAFEPGATLELLERERATIVAGWPHYAKAMAEHPSFAERDLSSIRSGNLYDVLPPEARPADPLLRSNSLGMTETGGPHTIDDMSRDLPERLRGAFGKSVPGMEHKIVDPETGASLPPGEEGEICVRGYSLMLGLYKTERADCFDADGFYHTGDSGSFTQDGYLFFKGRLGDMIKTGGANVTPSEVEAVLNSYPEVKESHVVGVPDPDRGQNVAAAVVLAAGASADPEDLRARVKAELSAYKVPRHLLLLESDQLPMTDSGKVDKRRLEQLLSARISP